MSSWRKSTSIFDSNLNRLKRETSDSDQRQCSARQWRRVPSIRSLVKNVCPQHPEIATKSILMAANSSIEWTESTWNPLTGCTKISPGCKHCYAERMSLRLKAMGQSNYVNGFQLTLHEEALELPLRWKKPQTIFVNSMSDMFHAKVPPDFN